MKLPLSKFFLFFSLFTFGIAAMAYAAQKLISADALVPWFWGIFAFIAIITFCAYLVSAYGISKGGETSIFTLMIVMGLKIFICMGMAIVYLLNFKVKSSVFMIDFFSLYFLFTAFEVYFLLRNLRDQK